ncbi:Major facilitator superfamily (MFS) permease [Flavobacterium indicum GPTSA100-9 = DSM 17447]|uniref:Major facilitator superfamily (MFS) permease n=1 Tax=Flavobacterium indicum (strain DSM 17447 / CIP 109464 / GPTSA100-9) TaxID=1094466 RepID=H8XV51_FLAIG|nr:MFS transporter [Flavobacterium indicum]CCG53021.1 Major facilitator superfamily (MFS) permease [Flavobacterium indicum GPTSA100-9 = DSM 17447]
MQKLKKGSRKLLNAWAFYDWANSVYALVISSSIFPLFFGQLFRQSGSETISFFGMDKTGETIISYITSFGFLIIAFTSPILSGIADYLGNKKFFMKFFCYMGSISCMLLYFFNLEYLYFGLTCYVLALIGFWGSLVFYNSYLPDIAFPEQQDAISAKGFSMGYIGSVVLLVINLAMVMLAPDTLKMQMMRYSFLMVGIWWLGFSQYTYNYLPNVLTGKKMHKDVVFKGFRELKKVWSQIKTLTQLKRYLGAFFIYSMAVQTVMIIAAYFGEKEVQWGSDSERTTGLIISILLIQLIAVVGAFLTSKASAKFGNIKVLMVINFLWILICIDAYFVVTPVDFYIAASLVGIVMGGIQSLSRSTYSKLIPQDVVDTTSFFSFYDVAEKIGIVIGMFTYGFIADITGKMQNAILFLIVFFAIGFLLLYRMDVKK